MHNTRAYHKERKMRKVKKSTKELAIAALIFIGVYGMIGIMAGNREEVGKILYPTLPSIQQEQDVPVREVPIDVEAEELSKLDVGEQYLYIDELVKHRNHAIAFAREAEKAALLLSVPSELPKSMRGK